MGEHSVNFHYITVATKPNDILDKLKSKVSSQNENIQILGTQENRYIGWQSIANFGVKLQEVYHFLNSPDLNDNDIVLFTDAYDVIYCGTQSAIIQRYLHLDKPIIFGCEKLCNPDPNIADKYIFTNTEFPYLNSGLFIGRVWALKLCMLGYKFNDQDDDQRYWTSRFLANPVLIGLDYNNDLFLNTADINIHDISWDTKNAYYKGNNPLFIHINGPDKRDIQKFI